MNQNAAPVEPDQVGRNSQIIVAGLMTGLLMFGVIAYSIARGKQPELGVISYLGAGMFAMNVVTGLAITRSVAAQSIQQIAAAPPADWRTALAPIYQRNQILSKALLEGAGFFNLIAYLIEAHWLSLAIVICIVTLMSVTFPSQTQFETWAEQVQREHS